MIAERLSTNENKGDLLYKSNLSAQMKIKGIYYINEFVRTNENKGNLLYKLNLSAQMKIKGIYYINWICTHKWK